MDSITETLYHKTLRVALVVMTCVLVFESGLFVPATGQLSRNTGQYLANAGGVSVGVSPNEINTWTAALTEKEQLLAAREDAVAAREIEVELNSTSAGSDIGTFALSSIVMVLLVLVTMNYALDYVRAKKAMRLIPSL